LGRVGDISSIRLIISYVSFLCSCVRMTLRVFYEIEFDCSIHR
jgi:hypothetical protein